MPNIIIDVWTRLHKKSMDDVDRDVQANFKKMAEKAADNFATALESTNPRIRKAASGVLDANSRVATSNKLLADSNRRVAEQSKAVADIEKQIADRRRSGLGIGASLAKDEVKLADARRDLTRANRDFIRDTDQFERAVRRQHQALKDLEDTKRRPGRGGGGGRSGFGGGQGGNALGGIFTSIPFVPGGKAGAIIGSGLVATLGSVADAAVTSSQALWLLPAAAAAGGAAFLTLKLGLSGFDKALKDMGDPKKFAQDLAGLAPNAQQAALEIQKLVTGLDGLKAVTQNALFKGVARQLSGLGQAFMPQIKQLTTGVATAFNEMFQSFAGQLRTPGTSAAIGSMINNIVQAFHNLAPAMAPVVDAFARIAKVGSDFLPGMATGIANLANKFANFISSAQQSGQLHQWIQKGIDAAIVLGRTIGEIAHKIFDVFGNKSPEQFKSTLDGMVGAAVTVAQAIEGVSRVVNSLVNDIKPIATAVGGWPNLIRDVIAAWALWKVTSLMGDLLKIGNLLGISLPAAAEKGGAGIAAALGKGGPAMIAIAGLLIAVDELHNRIQQENQWAGQLKNNIQNNIKAGQTPDQATANGLQQTLGPSPNLSRDQQAKALAGSPPDAIRKALGDATPGQVGPLLGGNIPQEVWDAMKGKPGWDTPQRSFPVPQGQGPGSQYPAVQPSAPTSGPGWAPNPHGTLDGGMSANDATPWGSIPVPGVPDKGKKGKLPKDVSPLDPSFGAPPRPGETEGEYSAEGTLMQAKHRKADDEATLQELEKDNNATAEQIQAQKNKIIQDQREINKAEMELQNAQEAAAKKQLKGYKDIVDGMKDIGPQLDEDFGLSKGLPGLAKNLVEFIGALAAAPLLGPLAAISAADPIKGGYGAIGIMGEANIRAGKSPLLGIPAGKPGGPSLGGMADSVINGMGMGAALGGGMPHMPGQAGQAGFQPGGNPGGGANLYQDAAGNWHSRDPWWEGVMQAESGGNINPPGNSTHFGLFQFAQSTWDGIARQVNPAWVGRNPGSAPADIQAQMAQENYNQNKGNLYGQWANGYVADHPGGTSGRIWSPNGGSAGGGGGLLGMLTQGGIQSAGFGQGGALAPLVGPGGPGTSPNGFPLNAPEASFSVGGKSFQAAQGAAGQRLAAFAQWFNDNIEPIKEFAGYDAGGHGLGNQSNHTSGTALDINWSDFTALQGHGADARTHFGPDKMAAISQALSQFGMTWGQYWTPDSRDPGHFELGGAPYSKRGPQNVGFGPSPSMPGIQAAGYGTGQGAGVGPFPGPPPSPGPGGGQPGFPMPPGPGSAPGPGGGTPGFPMPGGVDEGNPTPQGGQPGGQGGGWQPAGGEGSGLGLGGAPAAAITSAAGMFPGGGAAAQLAMKLANRTIQQAGEYAAIGVQGLQETFGVHDPDGGGNGLDDIGNNIFGRVLKGLAKAKPATPTSAGKTNGVKQQQGAQGQQGQPGQQAQQGQGQGVHFNIGQFTQAPQQNMQSTMNDLSYLGSLGAATPMMA